MSDRAAAIERFLVTEILTGVEVGALPHDRDLIAADLIDSLGITQLVSFLEEEYGIAVGDEDLTPENFRSIDSIAGFVSQKGG